MCEQPVVSRRGDGGVAADAIRGSGDSEPRDDGVTCDEVPLGSALSLLPRPRWLYTQASSSLIMSINAHSRQYLGRVQLPPFHNYSSLVITVWRQTRRVIVLLSCAFSATLDNMCNVYYYANWLIASFFNFVGCFAIRGWLFMWPSVL